MTKDRATAGPAVVLATTPVSTKMPVPMITPTPNTVRSSPDRCLLSRCSGSSVSRMESSTDLIRRIVATASSPRTRRSLRAAWHGSGDPACLRCIHPGHAGWMHRRWAMTGTEIPRDLPAHAAGPAPDPLPTLRPRPAGAPKATPARRPGQDVVVDCAVYVDGRRQAPVRPHEALETAQAEGGFVWLGLYEPTEDELTAISQRYGLHPLAVEDAVYAHQRPKLEHYDEALFMVLKTARHVEHEQLTATSAVVDTGEVMVFVGDSYVITVRHGEHTGLTDLRARLEEQRELLCLGPSAVLYAVAD